MVESMGLMHNIKSWSFGLFGSMSFVHTTPNIQFGNERNVGPLMACYSSHFLQIVTKTTISKLAQCDEKVSS
jgi:hypothetical protein